MEVSETVFLLMTSLNLIDISGCRGAVNEFGFGFASTMLKEVFDVSGCLDGFPVSVDADPLKKVSINRKPIYIALMLGFFIFLSLPSSPMLIYQL